MHLPRVGSYAMKQCPRCQHARSWLLSDGRRKCRRCSRRYSWTSAWDSIRLPARVKRRLLQKFAIGVPVYRLKHHSGVSLKSHERFNRVVRAVCALEEGVNQALCSAELFSLPERGSSILPPENRPAALRGIEFAISLQDGHVAAVPERSARRSASRSRIEARLRKGPLVFESPQRARVLLALRSGRVVCTGPERAPTQTSDTSLIGKFCHFAMEWLQPYGTIRHEYFHLYMGEICYRFNHRNEPLETRLLRLLRARSVQDLRPLWVRNRWVTGAPEN